MSIDGLSLHAVLCEARCIEGGKIDKVQQPDRDSILLTIRGAGRTSRLLICIHAENGRVQLTDMPFENPAEPPMFCMLLRKYLIGCRIESVVQAGLDRYFSLCLSGRNELGDSMDLKLCVELMDRHSNVTLVQDGRILDCLRRVTPEMSPVRTLLPGTLFTDPPAQEKTSLFDLTGETLASILSENNPVAKFQAKIGGVSRNITTLLFGDEPDPGRILSLISELKKGNFRPCTLYRENREPVCVIPFRPLSNDRILREYPSMSRAFDDFYREKDAVIRIQRNSASLKKSIEIKLKRSKNKIAMYEQSILAEDSMDRNRSFGELLNANLYLLKRGQSACKVTDYSLNPPSEVLIPLDPLLTPTENAQRYFKKYKKAKAAREYALSMITKEKEETEYLEGQLDNLSKCSTLRELSEIRDELVQLKYLKSDRKMKPSKKECTKPMCFLSSDGIRIFVGKNNRQNDELTLHTSASDNLWLHTKEIPGSHVLIDHPGMPPEKTLNEAGMLAAFYSKARSSSSVPVDYTLRRNVKKPSGAKPGKVIYVNYQTMYITPDEAAVRSLKKESEGE